MKDDEAAARRAKVLLAARWCFLNFGFAKTSFEDIAKRANLSRTLLYRIFKDKEDIFRAVFEDWLVSRHPAARQAATAPGSAYERLIAVCRLVALDPWAEMVSAPMGREFSRRASGSILTSTRSTATSHKSAWRPSWVTRRAPMSSSWPSTVCWRTNPRRRRWSNAPSCSLLASRRPRRRRGNGDESDRAWCDRHGRGRRSAGSAQRSWGRDGAEHRAKRVRRRTPEATGDPAGRSLRHRRRRAPARRLRRLHLGDRRQLRGARRERVCKGDRGADARLGAGASTAQSRPVLLLLLRGRRWRSGHVGTRQTASRGHAAFDAVPTCGCSPPQFHSARARHSEVARVPTSSAWFS